MGIMLMKNEGLRTTWLPTLFAKSANWMGNGCVAWVRLTAAAGLLAMGLAAMAWPQGVSTTTVQGTVYLANGQPGAGTLVINWPGFTTAAGQAVAADKMTVTIATDGFLSVNLAPNLGATPAGEYYTAVYYMSDGSVNTQYWVIPAAASATLAQVQAQVMPAVQAVQTVSKAYVDEAITELAESLLTASGGTLSGPLYLNADPSQAMQAATKHYVDTQVATAVPLAGGNMTGPLTTPAVNGVESPTAASGNKTLQAAINAAGANGAMEIPPNYAGTDTFTNPNGVKVVDLRTTGAQQTERSVKEFGAVCDGVTDDTTALQAALSYANAHGVALTIPEGICKTRTLGWHGESIGGLGKQVSALMGFPGQDVLANGADAANMLSYTRLHDLTIYVDQSVDVSCMPAEGRAAAGSCSMSRPMEKNSIFSPGANGLTGTVGTGAAWWLGNCAIALQALTGTGGNGLKVAEIENVEIATTGVDPMATQYPGAHSTHTCGLYLAQWPQWSEFRNIDIRGLNTGVAIPALAGAPPAGLNADSNRWQNVTIQAVHAFTAAAGSNNVLDNVVALAGDSSAAAEPPTGLVLDLSGAAQGWTVRNTVVIPTWNAVQPALTLTAAGGAVTAVTVGSQKGLGWDPYGMSVPVAFSGSCTAQATAAVNANGSIASVTVTAGGVGCSSTTTASVSAPGTWDTAAPVNLIGGQDMTLFAGNLLKGNGGFTVWNAGNSSSYGTQVDGGGGTLPGGGTYAALVRNSSMGSAFAVDQFPGADIGAKIQACVNALNASYGGTCDARNFTGNLSMASRLTITTPNTAVLLPCATITTANQIVVTAGTRNVALRGCALRGGTAASGSQGGTVFAYSGTGAMVMVGDATYALDTPGFHMENVAINTTAASSATAQGLVAYRTQEIDLESLYFLGNQNQTGMTLDGTGNYTGGTFQDNQFTGFGTAVNAIGHQAPNAATTDWMNASTFVRLHIDCPTASGNPISGTYGFNLQQGDGNTFTGGDIEGCATALHLGANAEGNTIVGLRNENSTNQIVADAGSAYNNWMSGGAIFTGRLSDNGTRNSFLDTFHRSFNGLNGDWYGSQQDVTLTNHLRLGTGVGNERGLLNEVQTDYGYRWTYGFSDGTSGAQAYEIQDLLNNVPRISVGQYLSAAANVVTNVVVNNGGCYTTPVAPAVSFTGGGGTGATAAANLMTSTSLNCSGGYTVGSVTVTSGGSGYTSQPTLSFSGANQTTAPNAIAEVTTAGSTNNQTVINSAGTGAVILNGSNKSGTGGVVFGSGGATEATVATVDNAGDAQFNGTLQVGGTMQSTGTITVRNNADAEVDYYLWPGLTTSQKGSYTYKDWNGNSQWYMVKDASNNWALNSAVGGLDSFKAYQSTNSGDSYINASNTSGHIRLNYESGSGAETDIYSGSSANLVAAFLSPTSIKLPGLAATSGRFCLQVDSSGYVTNTGAACGTGSGGSGSGTVNSGNTGQIAYYAANGTTLSAENFGTANLADWTNSGIANGLCAVWNSATGKWTPGSCGSGSGNQVTVVPYGAPSSISGSQQAYDVVPSTTPVADIRAWGGKCDGSTDIGPAISSILANMHSEGAGISEVIEIACGAGTAYWDNPSSVTASGVPVMIRLQGILKLGSSLVANTAGIYNIESDGPPGPGIEFQPGSTATIAAPAVYGTLGTAITTQDAAATITPNFASGNIAHLPVGSAITIAGTTTASATAVGITQAGGGSRLVTLTLVPMSTPPQPSGSPSGSGGTVTASNYNTAYIVAVGANGEYTAVGAQSSSITTSGSTSSISWSWAASTGPVSSYWIMPCNTNFCAANQITTYFSGTASSLCTGGTCTYVQTLPAASGATLPVNFSLTGSHPRFIPMETLNVSGCSDSTLNINGGAILGVDYSATSYGQITYGQTTTTASTTATGCVVTSFDEDKFESARVVCSNGTNFPRLYSGTCSSGQIVIYTGHPHSASDKWGEVALDPGYANQGNPGFMVSNIDVVGCYGMCYWEEQASNTYIHNLGVDPLGYLAAGGIENTASWKGFYSQIYGSPTDVSQSLRPLCGAGSCSQPAYPYSLRCDSGSTASALGYEGGTGCVAYNIDGGAIIGGVKIDGGGRRAITGLPYEIEHMLIEQAPNAGFVIDNRFGFSAPGCISLNDNSLQDNLTQQSVYDLAYTNQESPSSGCYKFSGLSNGLTTAYTNPYFNDAAIYDRLPSPVSYTQPWSNTASDGTWNDGVEFQGPWRGAEADFGPQILPFGSLPIANSPSAWTTLCAGAGCTVNTTNVQCPDGSQAASKMQCAEIDGPGNAIAIGTWTGSTYAGDQFIGGCYARPGANYTGLMGNQNQDAIMLYTNGTDAFTPNAFGGTAYTTPSYGFGPKLIHETWAPLIFIATIATGESAAHTINFEISGGNGNSSSYGAGYGNQFSNCRWAFVPGPNNPGYTGVTPDEVAFARDNQYRGAIPSNAAAGIAATEETISTNGFQVNGVPLNAPSETYNASASGAITLPTADRAEATYVLSGNVTASIGSGTGGGEVTIIVCQPASGGPYTWTWPANWKGGVTLGMTANTCSEQKGTYIAGLSDWHGDAGTSNVAK